jgi:hypothetical protein
MHSGDSPYSFAVFFFLFFSFSGDFARAVVGFAGDKPTKTTSCSDNYPVFSVPDFLLQSCFRGGSRARAIGNNMVKER